MSVAPPRLARALLRLLPEPAREHVAGDLEEEYASRILPVRGKLRADLWFWWQAARSVLAFVTRRDSVGSIHPRRPSLGSLVSDLRLGFRSMARQPGFAAIAILTLGVGIGVATSVFSVANWVLYRPVPGVDEQQGLFMVRFEEPNRQYTGVSYPTLVDLEAASPAVTALAGHQAARLQAAGEGLEPTQMNGEAVTAGYFELLGITADRGRLFAPAELEPGSQAAVFVLSHDFWVSRLGAEPGVIGRTLRLNGSTYTVVGVAEREFRGTERLGPVDVWVPAPMYYALRHIPDRTIADRGPRPFMNTLGRLAPGASARVAQQQLSAAMERIIAAYPDEAGIHESRPPVLHERIGFDPLGRPYVEQMIALLSGLVTIVLLVACANVANLLVLRGVHRRGSTAVRRALGASRGRIVRQELAESLVLAVPAGVAGVLVAYGLNGVFWSAGFAWTGPIDRVGMDLTVLAFAVGIGIATTLGFGSLPALLASRVDVAPSLKGAERASTGRTSVVRGGLTAVQLSLSLALLVVALLLGRTLRELHDVPLGFDPEGLLAFYVSPGPQGYSEPEAHALGREVLERLRALPSVRLAALSANAPFAGGSSWSSIVPPGTTTREDRVEMSLKWVTEGYFEVLDAPLVSGRAFRREDMHEESDVVVLSRALARQLFGDRDAVGSTVDLRGFDTGELRVIGVAEDVRDGDLRGGHQPILYRPYPEYFQDFATFLIRSEAAPERLARDVRAVVAQVDPNLPVFDPESMDALVDRRLSEERTLVRLSAVAAALAIFLASVGLYGVVAHSVAQRTREIGVRVALGADAARIVSMIMRHAALFGLIGVALGAVTSAALARLLEARLFNVAPFDPAVFASAALLLGLVVLAASALPALSATRVDPVRSLRVD